MAVKLQKKGAAVGDYITIILDKNKPNDQFVIRYSLHKISPNFKYAILSNTENFSYCELATGRTGILAQIDEI
jgi:hypothetical protein